MATELFIISGLGNILRASSTQRFQPSKHKQNTKTKHDDGGFIKIAEHKSYNRRCCNITLVKNSRGDWGEL